jgi:hypothetical protein
MSFGRSATYFVISALFVAFAGAAQATVYDVSIKNRNFCCTNPNVFAFGAPQAMAGYHTVVATASQTGASTQPIKFAKGHAAHFYSMFFIPDLPPISLKTNSGTFSVSNGAGTLMKGGGHAGAASFCPKAIGPGPGACTNPGLATPTPFFNGQVKVAPGPNKFGGTMQILAGPGGVGGSKFFVYRFLGGSNMSAPPAALVNGAVIDAPVGASMIGAAVFAPGPQYIGYMSPTSVPPFMMTSFPNAGLSIHGAGKFTTGMVTVAISMFNNPPVRTVMLTGADNRTPAGLGNIQGVSGIVFNAAQPGAPAPGSNVIGWRMNINVIPEPGPTLGLAAGALGLLFVGMVRSRRSH